MSDARRTFTAALCYSDPLAALDWLEQAFGFERLMVITDADGALVHSEMSYGDGQIMVGRAWDRVMTTPGDAGNRTTFSLHVHLTENVDEHFARAKKAGAEIMAEPEDQFYGDRTYRARDLEGHVWTFGQTVKAVTREEAEVASGLKIEGWI